MRRTAWRLFAAASLIVAAGGATRPHYGGTLRVQASSRLAPFFDGLVTFSDSGQILPALATSWRHDAEFKRWEFQLRRGVKFHDGSPLTAEAVAHSLEQL